MKNIVTIVCLCFLNYSGYEAAAQQTDASYGQQGHLILNNEERLDLPTLKPASDPTNPRAHVVLPDGSLVFGVRSSGSGMFTGPAGGILVGKLDPTGTADLSFGNGGYFFYSTPKASLINEISVDPDGKVLVAAQSANYDGVLIRLKPNGTLDSSFGANGIAQAANTSAYSNDGYTHVVRRTDGKYWILRTQTNFSVTYKYLESMLLKANGTRDSSYGVNGLTTYSSIRYPSEQELFPVLHANGYLSVVYNRDSNSVRKLAVFRIKPDGTADSSLGTAGQLIYSFMPAGIQDIYVTGAADGSGYYMVYPGPGDSSYVYNFRYSGQLDSAYGINGRSVLRRAGDKPSGRTLWLRPDGKLQVTANSGTTINLSYLFLLKENGAIDSSYGTLGAMLIPNYPGHLSGNSTRIVSFCTGYSSAPRDSANFYFDYYTLNGTAGLPGGTVVRKFTGSKESLTASARQANGTAIIAGIRYQNPMTNYNNQTEGIWLRRLLPDGTPDAGFGTGGIAYNTDGKNSGVNDLAILANNRIVTVGKRMIRIFSQNGQQEVSLDVMSLYPTYLDSNVVELMKVLVLANGKIQVLGSGANSPSVADRISFMLRLDANGVPDAGFGLSGFATGFASFSPSSAARSMTSVANGKSLVSMSLPEINSNAVLSTSAVVVRMMADGLPDNSFGTNGKIQYTESFTNRIKPRDILVLPDSSFLLLVSRSSAQFSGSGYSGADTTSSVLHYSANGIRDMSFGNGGIATIHGTANRIQLLRDNRLLLASLVNNWGAIDAKPQTVWLTRLKYNGRPDSSFGTNGYLPLSDRYSSINPAYHANFEEVRTDPMPALLLPLGDSSSFLAGSTMEMRNWDPVLQKVSGFRDSLPAQQLTLLDTLGTTSCNPLTLFWVTTNERGSDRFFLQRSIDGSNFTTIATISAVGTSYSGIIYQYDYIAPDTLMATYRVVLMGRVGSAIYSNQILRRRTNASLTPALTISYTGCGTNTLVFRPTSQNAGAQPTYQWYVNNGLYASGSIFLLSNPVNGSQVYAILTSSLSCASPQSATSQTVTVQCTTTAVSNIDGLEYAEANPNPTSGNFTVRYRVSGSRMISFVVRDGLGRIVLAVPARPAAGAGSQALDLHGMASGLYYLELRVGNKRRTIPMLVRP